MENEASSVFKSSPQTTANASTAPSEETTGSQFYAWLQHNFSWMFGTPSNTPATVGQSYVYADGPLGQYNLLGEYSNGGLLTQSTPGQAEYLWLPTEQGAQLIGMLQDSRLHSVHTDHLGTPRLVKDPLNTPVWQWAYSGFGDNLPLAAFETASIAPAAGAAPITRYRVKASNVILNLRFPGQYWDDESKLSYNYYRSYQPGVGRYAQADPIGLGGGDNRFAYVGGSPLGYSDPMGLQARGNVTPGGPGASLRWPSLGPEPREVVGPYSTTTQSRTVNGINQSRGRMGNSSENLLDFFGRNANGPINMSTTRDGALRFETTLPNGTRMQYREGPNGARVDIFPPGGTSETMHAPSPIGGVCLR